MELQAEFPQPLQCWVVPLQQVWHLEWSMKGLQRVHQFLAPILLLSVILRIKRATSIVGKSSFTLFWQSLNLSWKAFTDPPIMSFRKSSNDLHSSIAFSLTSLISSSFSARSLRREVQFISTSLLASKRLVFRKFIWMEVATSNSVCWASIAFAYLTAFFARPP